jgi:uncharacterized protein (UPF0261 family)
MGQIDAVIDMTLAEGGTHLVGGLHDAASNRLEAAGWNGLPQVVVPGAADTIVPGSDGALKDLTSPSPRHRNEKFREQRISKI